MLEHGTPCLAFAAQETAHVNVWKNRLAETGASGRPVARVLKRASSRRGPTTISSRSTGNRKRRTRGSSRSGLCAPRSRSRAARRSGYVTDVADTAANRESIVRLVRDADFSTSRRRLPTADAALAADRAHLTTAAAGSIAREAGVRVEPFHFSPRYAGDEARLTAEVLAAFSGGAER